MNKELINTNMWTTNHDVSNNDGDMVNPNLEQNFSDEDVIIEVDDDDEPIIEILGAEYGDPDLGVSFLSDEESFVLIDVMPEDDVVDDDDVVVDEIESVDEDIYDDPIADDDGVIDDDFMA